MNKTLKIAVSLLNDTYPHILEFGVWYGETLAQIRNTTDLKYKLFGFDSFYGLPEDWSYTTVKKGGFNLNGNVPEHLLSLPNTTIIPGWFKDTIPLYLKSPDNISLLHIDSDLYSSCREILYSDIKNFIKQGSLIVFDEWFYNMIDTENNRQHEQKCFFEWVNDFKIEYELLPSIEPERQIIRIK